MVLFCQHAHKRPARSSSFSSCSPPSSSSSFFFSTRVWRVVAGARKHDHRTAMKATQQLFLKCFCGWGKENRTRRGRETPAQKVRGGMKQARARRPPQLQALTTRGAQCHVAAGASGCAPPVRPLCKSVGAWYQAGRIAIRSAPFFGYDWPCGSGRSSGKRGSSL